LWLQIVSNATNAIDVDKLDYLVRDIAMTGVTLPAQQLQHSKHFTALMTQHCKVSGAVLCCGVLGPMLMRQFRMYSQHAQRTLNGGAACCSSLQLAHCNYTCVCFLNVEWTQPLTS
jgi:hypothetical protein